MDNSGHEATYTQSTATASAIQHNGNVYGNVTNNYGDRDNTTSRNIIDLPYAKEAAFDSQSKENDALCLLNTRTEVLERIRAWTYKEEGSCIFWLNGMAGTGKSTIARTLAHEFRQKKELGASFFFVRGGGDVAHARFFITTVAKQLSYTFPAVEQHISDAIRNNLDIATKAQRDQWDKLVAQPLAQIETEERRPIVVIVVDALDECDDDASIRGIVSTLSQANRLTGVRLRIIITSRPETPIRLGFKSIPAILHQDLILHDVSREVVDADIRLFLLDQFEKIQQSQEWLASDWPGINTVNYLIRSSEGLFIFAATVCRFVADQQMAEDALELFTSDREGTIVESDDEDPEYVHTTFFLDCVYTQILQHAMQPRGSRGPRLKPRIASYDVIGTIAALVEPLPAAAIASLLGVRKSDIVSGLDQLHSVVRIPDNAPVRLFHASFRDFLFDQQRCASATSHLDELADNRQADANRFWVDATRVHSTLAARCLWILNQPGILRQSMCASNSPGNRRADVTSQQIMSSIAAEVAYACSYWPWHIVYSAERLHDDSPVLGFLKAHFLHWLEALSWLGRLSTVVSSIDNLQRLVQPDQGHQLRAFLFDARRFVLRNRHIIDIAPLQAYYSAISFTPAQSIIRQTFKDQCPKPLSLLPSVPQDWSAEILRLEGHDEDVTAVAFSPDGEVVASASWDQTVRLWNAKTGEETQKLEGHDSWVTAIAFSPDGEVLASASDDKTVRLWNAETGEEMQKLEGHDAEVTAVAFSPDGEVLISASDDKTVRLWNAETGEEMQKLEGHDSAVTAAAFSPDGEVVASASWDQTVRLWNAKTGEETQKLDGHDSGVTAIAFSADGEVLASTSDDKTVRLWNAETGEEMQKLEGHDAEVTAVAFSPDGEVLTSASSDQTVRLWNAKTGEETQKLDGHDGWVTAVAFSPDGEVVASASWDRTVRLWNAKTGEKTQKLEGHDEDVTAVVFSPDGEVVASASRDTTVRLWNAKTGEEIYRLQGDRYIDQMEFVHNGTILRTNRGEFDASAVVKPFQDLGSLPNTNLELQDQWIRSGGQDILWLPTEYRGTCSGVLRNTLVTGSTSGLVSIFRLNVS